MHKYYYLLFLGIFFYLSSCRKDFDTVPNSGSLQFSKQTVYLDTIFSNIGSSTYLLKVYNRSNKDINIPTIRLGKSDSKYRLLIDGLTGLDSDNSGQGDGKFFMNVELLAKDSLFIFIETTVDIAETETDFTYNDQIVFDSGTNQQTVNLVTLIQDVKLIIPNRTLNPKIIETLTINGEQTENQGHTLLTDEELHWTNEKPYLVYGYALVPPGKTLVIDPGTKVHFHAGSGIIVDVGGKIEINGSVSTYDSEGEILVNNEVNFEGDRLEPRFSETPGQWNAILILSGLDNKIDHLTLKNATVGIFMPRIDSSTLQPKLEIKNSQIYNSSNIGIYGRNAIINGKNLVVNLAGQACFAGIIGGNYSMTHCTFNNNWASSKQLAVLLSNYELVPGKPTITGALEKADFFNSIIYGSNNVELVLDKLKDQPNLITPLPEFFFNFGNCLIKFNDAGTLLENDPLYDFVRIEGNPLGNKKNLNPIFLNANKNKLNISPESGAYRIGSTSYIETFDIKGIERPLSENPDAGAYKAVEFPN